LSGLVTTPSKTKAKRKQIITLKALKQALRDTNLHDILRLENVCNQPLSPQTIDKIKGFVSLPAAELKTVATPKTTATPHMPLSTTQTLVLNDNDPTETAGVTTRCTAATISLPPPMEETMQQDSPIIDEFERH
jgi:hypothetical protein